MQLMARVGISKPRRLALAGVLIGLGLGACAPSGPASAADVCDAFTELADEVGAIGSLTDNGVFREAKDLGQVAVRYEQDSSIVSAGELLIGMGDSDQTSSEELDRAAHPIAGLCGKSSLSGYAARRTLGIDD